MIPRCQPKETKLRAERDGMGVDPHAFLRCDQDLSVVCVLQLLS